MQIQIASLQTQKRRVAQRLFKELDRWLAPHLGQKLALAVSGGLDSRALMEAIARWPLRPKSRFVVIVVNHHLRLESGAEAKAVSARARMLGFESEILSVFPGSKKDEASLRQSRYDAISRFLASREIRVLCTAHQRDDDAEGVIMDLFGFGGGQNGVGIKKVRKAEFGVLVRPFLELERRELLLFLNSVGVTSFFCDPSNEDGSCARQRARDFLRHDARALHAEPVRRLAELAQKRCEEGDFHRVLYPEPDHIPLSPEMPEVLLRAQLHEAYKRVCPHRDPRDARLSIELVVKKAGSLAFIRPSGVDPSANSITVRRPVRLNFDLPGAKVLMTPVFLSLYRNQNDLLVQ